MRARQARSATQHASGTWHRAGLVRRAKGAHHRPALPPPNLPQTAAAFAVLLPVWLAVVAISASTLAATFAAAEPATPLRACTTRRGSPATWLCVALPLVVMYVAELRVRRIFAAPAAAESVD